MVVGKSPVANQKPPKYKDQVLHSSLKKDELEIMATDMQGESLIEGNSNHLCLICKMEAETRSLFPSGKPLPLALIRKIVRFRVKESEDGTIKWRS